jgi:hypothetical protein
MLHVQAIVKIPAIEPPPPVVEKIDPKKRAVLSFPGDKKTKIDIPSGSFPAGASVEFAPRPFNSKATPIAQDQSPGGPVLSFKIQPPGTKALKKVKLELQVSRVALEEYLFITKGRREAIGGKRLLQEVITLTTAEVS